MIKHYVKVAFRNFWKYKTFSLLNVTGLAIGMAGAMLLLLWIQNQLEIDQFHEKKQVIYKVYTNETTGGQIQTHAVISAPLAASIKTNVAGIKDITRVREENKVFRYSEAKISALGNAVDPSFLEMFSFPLVNGNIAAALKEDNAIVISEKLAKILFRQEDPVNKIIYSETDQRLIVKGVFKDLSANTQFKFDYLLPWKSPGAAIADNTSWDRTVTAFVEVEPSTSIAAINGGLNALPNKFSNNDTKKELFLYPLSKLWLRSDFKNGKAAGGVIDLVRLLAIIALVILLIACINFMNLSTARSLKRAKEVGLRKVIGGTRRSLIGQFIGESVFVAFVSGIIALGIVTLMLPSFNILTEKQLTIHYNSPYAWFSFILFILFTGVLAGIYPAFFLSAFKPVKALKGVFEKGNAFIRPRKVLFVFQFCVAIIMINFTILLKKQVAHLQDREIGFIKEGLVFQAVTTGIKKNYTALTNELLQSGTVASVSGSNLPITRGGSQVQDIVWPGKDKNDPIDFDLRVTSNGFIATNGLSLISGRDINTGSFPSDTLSCLINKSAVRVMGLKDPIGQTIREGNTTLTVVGVVKDFITASPLQAVSPVLIKGSNEQHFLSIRLSSSTKVSTNLSAITAIIKKYNPNFITELNFADKDYNLKVRGLSLTTTLTNIFSFIAIFIACLGLLGLVMYTVETKAKEISIRKVFGANMGSVISLLSRDFVKLVTISILIASPLAWLLMGSFLRPFYYRIHLSGWILVETGLLALLITFITISSQSVKAALTDPVKDLRSE